MVQRLLVILLVVSFAALPFRLIASENSGCAVALCDPPADETAVAVTPSCCMPIEEPTQEQPGGGSDEAPSEPQREHRGGCDCPLACCGIVKTLAAITIKLSKPAVQPGVELPAARPQDGCGSPHIKRLKRPPRPLTTTV